MKVDLKEEKLLYHKELELLLDDSVLIKLKDPIINNLGNLLFVIHAKWDIESAYNLHSYINFESWPGKHSYESVGTINFKTWTISPANLLVVKKSNTINFICEKKSCY